MQASTVNELKKELTHLSPKELIELCTRLARFKKENKELLTYLLFEAHDEHGYVASVKEYIDTEIAAIPSGNSLYLIKKSLRKILRTTSKYIRFSGSKTTEIELLIYFLSQVREAKFAISKSQVLINLYENQLKKVAKLLPALHEDLQHDYGQQVAALQLPSSDPGLISSLLKRLR
jgi:hypothetical protein